MPSTLLSLAQTARRFFVPTVSSDHIQDFQYFGAITDQLENDSGYEALLYHLLNEVDLRDFEVRQVPRTAGLLEQIAYSRRGVDGLVEAVCSTARVPNEHPSWPGFTVTSGAEEGHGFEVTLSKSKDPDLARMSALTVSKRLCKDWGCASEQKRESGDASFALQGIQWPPLIELRQRFIASSARRNGRSRIRPSGRPTTRSNPSRTRQGRAQKDPVPH